MINKLLKFFGLKVTRLANSNWGDIPELTENDRLSIEYVVKHELSMTSVNSLATTLMACKYVQANMVPGDFVECGVWRGGNSIIAADFFMRMNSERRVLMFDTFEGMTKPTEHDIDLVGNESSSDIYDRLQNGSGSEWCKSEINQVQSNFTKRGINLNYCRFYKGDVKNTIPNADVGSISVLRLDTDWYESTKMELEELWPKLSVGGVLIIDDYGKWGGSKKAVDEFFVKYRPFFIIVDGAGRVGVKLRSD